MYKKVLYNNEIHYLGIFDVLLCHGISQVEYKEVELNSDVTCVKCIRVNQSINDNVKLIQEEEDDEFLKILEQKLNNI